MEDNVTDGTITILLIEDNAGDARVIRETLEEETGTPFKLVHTTRLQSGLERLAQGDIDVALLDLSLPDSRGIDTFNQVLAHSPDVPIIVLTGLNDESAEIQVLQAGGQDFLNKGFLNLSVIHQSIRHATLRKRTAYRDDAELAVVAANREHDQFLGLLCEELRVPLAILLLTIRAMTEKPAKEPEVVATVAIVRRYLEQQARLIDDLQTYSRVGIRRAAFQATACESALEQALVNLKPSIDETDTVVTHDPLPSVWADESQVRLVFQNLISSAIKNRGKDQPRIHLAAERQGDQWMFSVSDNGIAVDPKRVERLFNIFHRLHDQDEYPGAGFGLATCKKIVERHAGRIWAESAPGEGNRFLFTIPANS